MSDCPKCQRGTCTMHPEYVSQDECPHLEAPTDAVGICPTCLAVVDKCEECSKVNGAPLYHVMPACEPYRPSLRERAVGLLQGLTLAGFHLAAPIFMPLVMRYWSWRWRRQALKASKHGG